MGWFKKEEKEKKVETDITKKGQDPMIENVVKVDVEKEYPYIIKLYDVDGTTAIEKNPFGAKRYIDGANVWLVNEKMGFKEPIPEDNDDYKNYKLEEVHIKIKDIEDRLKLLNDNKKKKTIKTINKSPEELDLLTDMKILKGYARSLDVQGRGSYMIISQPHGGRPLYSFFRKGNFKLPVFTNTDLSLLYVPNETNIATAGDLLQLNEDKNGNKDNSVKLATLGMFVLTAIVLLVLIYFLYKSAALPTDFIDGFKAITENMNQVTNNMDSLVDKLNNSVTVQPQTITPQINPSTTTINN